MKEEKEQLEDEMLLDELTQLYNRRSFRIHTEQFLEDPQVETLSILMIDVDYFKQYNDSYGHNAGDHALRSVAACLPSDVENGIYSYRYGGDEFITICKNISLIEVEGYIRNIAMKLKEKSLPHESSFCSKHVTLSIGYNFHTRSEKSFDLIHLIIEADQALYQAKKNGRNCSFLYSSSGATESIS